MSSVVTLNGNVVTVSGSVLTTESGGNSNPDDDVLFYDYDGTLLYSYSASAFAQLNSLPDEPTHAGLTTVGWNWTLADAKSHVAKYGFLDIGCTYIPTDGKTKVLIDTDVSRNIYVGFAINGSGTIDWGDDTPASEVSGSDLTTVVFTPHQYTQAGKYTISIDISNGTAKLLGESVSGRGSYLIHYTNSTTQVTVNDAVQYICYGIHFGNNMKLGNNAFYGFYNLKFVTFTVNCLDSNNDSSIFWMNRMKAIIIPNGCNYRIKLQLRMQEILTYSLPKPTTNVNTQFSSILGGNTCIKRFSIPDGYSEYSMYSFGSDCRCMQRINIPSAWTYLTNYMFSGWYSLGKIIVPDHITNLGYYTLKYLYGTEEIDFMPTSVPIAQSSTFDSYLCPSCKFYVPYSALANYLTATNYPSTTTYTYIGFATYANGATLPTQDSTSAYNVTWYANKLDAIAQTNAITQGTGTEIYCRYVAI